VPVPVFDPPAEIGFATPFWDATADGHLRLPRCSACGQWQWYPDLAGADCAGAHLIWDDVEGTGIVYTFTVVRRSFLPDQRDVAPYTIILVELDGVEGLRLVANLADGIEPRIGMRVRATFPAVGSHAHPIFVPAEGPESTGR
jgi:uncharacterized OB-fold protein